MAGLRRGTPVAQQPQPEHLVAGAVLPGLVDPARIATGVQAPGDDAQGPVAEADEVAGGARGGGLVVDRDAVRARGARATGYDRGQPAAQGCGQGRVTVGGGVGDQPVDRGVADEALRGLRGGRDELQGQARGRRGGGHAVQERDRAGIPERVREGLGEQHAERATVRALGSAPAPAALGTGVAELRRRSTRTRWRRAGDSWSGRV